MSKRARLLLAGFLTLCFGALACSGQQGSLGRARYVSTPSTYYVDCSAGSDSHNGRSKERAWRTLARSKQTKLLPGEQLLLKRGCTFSEPLFAPWRGTETKPISIGAYGQGARPKLTRVGAEGAALLITGSHQVIESLELSGAANPPPNTRPNCPTGWRIGFKLSSAANITVRDSKASSFTAGIFVDAGSSHNTLTHNTLVNNTYLSVNTPGGDDDSGAFGVLINGDHNVVSHNTFSGNASFCSYDYAQDGASVEIYGGSSNWVHHNISNDATAFAELGSSGRRVARDNVFAYNLYYNERSGSSDFLIVRGRGAFSPTPRTRAFNNTVYIAGSRGSGVVCTGCDEGILTLQNNILWVEGTAIYADAAFRESNNLIWSSKGAAHLELRGFDLNRSSLVANPGFKNRSGHNFNLTSQSPAITAGVRQPLHDALEVDLAGQPIAGRGDIDIGAFAFSGARR